VRSDFSALRRFFKAASPLELHSGQRYSPVAQTTQAGGFVTTLACRVVFRPEFSFFRNRNDVFVFPS
jgi:hypothetical protein